MAAANQYYYEMLGKEQRKAYHAMITGLMNLDSSFMVPRLSGKELSEIFFLIRLDHPEIFWSTRYTYQFYPGSDYVEMIPEYLFPKAKIREHKEALASRVRKLARPAESMKTELEKELYIHDFVLDHIHYDKLKKSYSHEIIGALENGVAVCEGIAKAVKILCDALNIWCVIALSDNNPEKGIKYRHTWNIIKINKNYYHLDATFDNSLTNGSSNHPLAVKVPRHDYFNLSDKQIFRDHEPAIYRLPVCTDSDHTWYREKKLSFTRMEEVKKRITSAVRKKTPFVFHWRGGYLTKKILLQILPVIRLEAARKGLLTSVSINWPQAVICVRFFSPETEEEAMQLKQLAKAEEQRIAEEQKQSDNAGREETGHLKPEDTLTEEKELPPDETQLAELQLQMEQANEGELYEESGQTS